MVSILVSQEYRRAVPDAFFDWRKQQRDWHDALIKITVLPTPFDHSDGRLRFDVPEDVLPILLQRGIPFVRMPE
jgi:hypothetical protein